MDLLGSVVEIKVLVSVTVVLQEELAELTICLHEVEDEEEAVEVDMVVAVEADKVLAMDVILALYVAEGVSLLEVPVELTNPLHEVKDETEGIEVHKVVAVEVPKVLAVEVFLALYMVEGVRSLELLVEMQVAELDLTKAW